MIKIKICGCRREEDILIVNKYQPDYIGFVFAKSRRMVSEEVAERMKQILSPKIRSVGVFVNAPLSQVIRLYEKGVIELVQLHGEETKEYIQNLKESIPLPIIKAIRVAYKNQIQLEQSEIEQTRLEQFQKEQILSAQMLPCDYLLLDTYQKGTYGGSGVSFDWSLIPVLQKPYFLAGGIHRENLNQAVSETNAFCLDISSGVEKDGVKDEELIKQILEYNNEIHNSCKSNNEVASIKEGVL